MTPEQLQLIYQDIQEVVANVGERFRQLNNTRLLVTGANSYVTSYIADTVVWLNDHWLGQPCQLLALVRSPVTSDTRLGHLLGRSDVEFIQQDVRDPIALDKPVDYIIHAASNASPHKYLVAPLDTMDANVTGTRHLLEMARRDHVKSMLFFSTSEIYGDVPDTFFPTPETYPGSVDCTAPRACYAEAKRYGETLCTTFWREYQVPVKIVRVFHVYGPGIRLNDGRVMADFIRDRVEKRAINLLSDGRGIRAFCYLVDATTGFWLTLLSEYNGEAFNIGTDSFISMRELAELVSQLETPKLSVNFVETDPAHLRGAPSRVAPNITKARQLLGYNPTITLSDGLTRTLRWYHAE